MIPKIAAYTIIGIFWLILALPILGLIWVISVSVAKMRNTSTQGETKMNVLR